MYFLKTLGCFVVLQCNSLQHWDVLLYYNVLQCISLKTLECFVVLQCNSLKTLKCFILLQCISLKTLGCFCILMYFLERSGCFVVWHYISLKTLGCLSYCMCLFEKFWIFCLKDWDVSFSCNVYPWKRWDVLLYSNVFLWKHWDVLLYYNVFPGSHTNGFGNDCHCTTRKPSTNLNSQSSLSPSMEMRMMLEWSNFWEDSRFRIFGQNPS